AAGASGSRTTSSSAPATPRSCPRSRSTCSSSRHETGVSLDQEEDMKATGLRASLALALAAAVAAVAGATADARTAAPAAQHGKVKAIAFFGFAAANSFAQATWAGVQEAAKRNHVQAKFFDPNFNSQTQVSQIEDPITTGRYQAFVIQANDGN